MQVCHLKKNSNYAPTVYLVRSMPKIKPFFVLITVTAATIQTD